VPCQNDLLRDGAQIAPSQTCLVWHSHLDSSTSYIFYVLYLVSCGLNIALCILMFKSELHGCQTCLASNSPSHPSTSWLFSKYLKKKPYLFLNFISCIQNWQCCILYLNAKLERETSVVWHWHSDPSNPSLSNWLQSSTCNLHKIICNWHKIIFNFKQMYMFFTPGSGTLPTKVVIYRKTL